MTREEVFSYVKSAYDILPDYPWQDENAVLRHPENRKWFAVVLAAKRESLGLLGEGTLELLNLKCDPLLLGSIRSEPGFFPAYHMNKEKWVSAALDGSASEEKILALLDESYALTLGLSKKRKGRQEEF